MTVSEAMRLGALTTEQWFGPSLFIRPGHGALHTCGLGAILLACGVYEAHTPCQELVKVGVPAEHVNRLAQIVVWANNGERWSRTKIAEYIEDHVPELNFELRPASVVVPEPVAQP